VPVGSSNVTQRYNFNHIQSRVSAGVAHAAKFSSCNTTLFSSGILSSGVLVYQFMKCKLSQHLTSTKW
jgi:hypothetical protein